MPFTCSNIKQKKSPLTTCAHCTFQICVNAEMYVTFENVFSEQRNQTPMKAGGPGDPASQMPLLQFSPEICIKNSFKDAG